MNPSGPELTPEIRETLERYLELQEEERRLQKEKTALQEKLKAIPVNASGVLLPANPRDSGPAWLARPSP